MYDCFKRNINYLRISLTDRCNLRCTYCMPAAGRSFLNSSLVLTNDEIVKCVATTAKLGITKVRFTGGEPLVRPNIVSLVRSVAKIPGIQDLAITTNGILLNRYAALLKESGLQRVNISLDSIDPELFRQITRGGDVNKVFEGIEAANTFGLTPVKINCVVEHSKEEPNALAVKDYCNRNDLQVRFIRKMDLRNGIFYHVEGGEGGKCGSCNRMRLTAAGFFKPCLFNSTSYSIREMGIGNAFLAVIQNKPKKGTADKVSEFYNVGG
jgi:GTP 3',8-cyclase